MKGQSSSRYERQIVLPEIGLEGQNRLASARVLVAGVGGLGCPALMYLVSAGVGEILLADGDRVEVSNLHRQPLFAHDDVGFSKAKVAGNKLSGLNPEITLHVLDQRIDSSNVRETIQGVDVVVDGSDNFATKYLLNDACVELGKPLVSASVFCFEGQVTVFNLRKKNGHYGPTYRCLFPTPPPASLIPSCAEIGVLGAVPGLLGTIQAMEVIKIVLEIGETLAGRLLVVDTLTLSFSEIQFERNEERAAQTKLQSAEYYAALSPACPMNIPKISPRELQEWMSKNKQFFLIDVREPQEKAEVDIGGELMPSKSILTYLNRIPRDQPVVVYCHSGARSAKVISELRTAHAFTNLFNLEGGMLAWQAEGSGRN